MLITGGAGFIGSNLAFIAHEHGWKVKVMDNLSTGLESNVHSFNDMGIEFCFGGIRDQSLINLFSKGCDVIVHLAAQVSVPLSISNPDETYLINVGGTEKIIEACLQNDVKRLVVASSAAVYGDADSLPLKEEDAGRVLSPYAETKWINEEQILKARNLGLNAIALRFFNVYGCL